MIDRKIKFNAPYYDEKELQNIKFYLSGIRDFKDDVLKHLINKTGAGAVFLTSSATTAMDLYFAAAGIEKGSEVIMPSFTFPSAANAILRAGLKPVFAEINDKTLVLETEDVKKKINKKTAVIMPVHYGGVSIDLDILTTIAKNNGLIIFEDSALSYLGYYKEKHLGTIGTAGILSFHSTKNISGDGGGALLIKNEKDKDIYEEILANGTNKPAFKRGEVTEYTWQEVGAGEEMGGLTAALIYSQLEKEVLIMSKREAVWNMYFKELSDMGIEEFARLPSVPDYNINNAHVFPLVFTSNELREKVRKKLIGYNIDAYIHYKPLHLSAMGRRLGYGDTELVGTKNISERLLRLPMHAGLTPDDAIYICEKIMTVVKNA